MAWFNNLVDVQFREDFLHYLYELRQTFLRGLEGAETWETSLRFQGGIQGLTQLAQQALEDAGLPVNDAERIICEKLLGQPYMQGEEQDGQ